MGYHGRPSTGCDKCRLRKIRCDQGKPACGQCILSKNCCPGYRDQLSVLFRDESRQVIQKATGTLQVSKTKREPVSNTRCLDEGFVDIYMSSSQNGQLPLDFPLLFEPYGVPEKMEAICFFFNRFAWQTSSLFFTTWKGSCSMSSKALVTGITSVGLVMLSLIRNSTSLRLSARDKYTSALQLTNAALSDKTEATSDTTLALIILLSLYETIHGVSSKTKDNWLGHVKGATTLLALRKLERLDTTAGHQLFREWRGQMLVGCLQSKTYVPRSVTNYGKTAMPLNFAEDAYDNQIATLTAKVANLRAAIRSKAIIDNSEILSAASALDAMLEVWADTLPTDWAYHTVFLTQNNYIVRTVWGELRPYNGCYHIYPDLAKVNGWCFYRVTRILINEIILECLRRVFSERETLGNLRNRFSNIRNTMNHLAGDICASAPYVLGILDDSQSEKGGRTCLGGYMLLLPLFTAGSVEGPTHPLRQFTLDCFQLIAYNIGIGHALADIDILRVQGGIVEWLDELDIDSNAVVITHSREETMQN